MDQGFPYTKLKLGENIGYVFILKITVPLFETAKAKAIVLAYLSSVAQALCDRNPFASNSTDPVSSVHSFVKPACTIAGTKSNIKKVITVILLLEIPERRNNLIKNH